MLTLEQAIEQYGQYINFCEYQGLAVQKEELEQMTEWLRELQERRKEPEIVHCGECRFNDGTAYCVFHFRDVKGNDFCSWAERRNE